MNIVILQRVLLNLKISMGIYDLISQ